MAELKKNLLRECPFCGGEAELIEYIETVDGRGDKIARVRCKCGCEIHLTMREFSQAEDDFGYKGGYYSQNKKFWNGMHQRLVDKWNNRPTESEIRAKAITEQKITNGQKIRAMSDEELAGVFDNFISPCTVCIYRKTVCVSENHSCSDGVLKWLKSEVKE